MRLDDLPESGNVEDRRGEGGGYGGGGMGGFPVGGGGLGIGTVVVLGLVGWALGIDPRLLIGGAEILTGGGQSYQQPYRPPQQGGQSQGTNDESRRFVSRVLGSTEVVWKDILSKDGVTYRPPKLIMFSGMTRSACGQAQSAMGPFYCPNDREVYLDASFFRDLETRFRGCSGKACDFSKAYVIAHEVGHHVQNELGILETANAERARSDKRRSNAISVRIELQADCIAGVWANRADRMRQILERGDIEEGLNAASAVGDDRLQRQARGVVVPDAFTHGSSAQRMHWFKTGLQSGNLKACDTFSAADLGGG